MINLLIGPPGGGKSYEAVVFHVLPALAKGRKVVTNLPLVMERISAIDATYPALIETRLKTKAVKPVVDWEKKQSLYTKFGIAHKEAFFSERAFANPEDFADPWRHEEDGSGPLYVIDECHLAFPRGGTVRGVEEWFSLHRHESADVLLMTQSYGKVSQSIIDLVQVCYRVRKGTAFGTSKQYVRKVQDGIRGDVVNESIRTYQKKYFGLYLSHTRGGGAELAAQDIRPFWKRWPVIGGAIMLPLGVALLIGAGGLPTGKKPTPKAQPVAKVSPAVNPVEVVPVAAVAPVAVAFKQPEPMEPYASKGLHYQGKMVLGDKVSHIFGVSQNGQASGSVTSGELEAAGYRVHIVGECTGWIYYGKTERAVTCDTPSQGFSGSTISSRTTSEGTPAGGGAAASGSSPLASSPSRSQQVSPAPARPV